MPDDLMMCALGSSPFRRCPTKANPPSETHYNQRDSMKMVRGLLGMVALSWAALAGAEVKDMPGGPGVDQLNLPFGVTPIAHDIYDLNWMIMIICTIIFIG